MTTLTVWTVLLVVYGIANRRGYVRSLALSGATPAGAAVVLGGIAVPTFYAVSIGAAVGLFLTVLGRRTTTREERQKLPPGGVLLVLFALWSFIVTLIAPLLFSGVAVFLPTTGAGRLLAGQVTSSNVAQTVYLVLGVCVFVVVARSTQSGPELIGLAVGTTVLLSYWRYLSGTLGLPFPEGVFDNSPYFAYIETAPGGVARFRGIHSEPAGLAATCLVAIAYLLPRALRVRGWRRGASLAIAAMALQLGLVSTSATFVVSGVALVVIAIVAHGFAFLARRTSLSLLIGMLACTLVLLAIWLLPIIADLVGSTVDSKLRSASFSERSGADSGSYGVFLQTGGLGAGLGANRASSFFPGLLSTTGFVGMLLFVAAVVTVVRRCLGQLEMRPVIWALITLLVLKVVAGPDLSDSSGVLWLSLGLLAGHAARVGTNAGAVTDEVEVKAPTRPLPTPSVDHAHPRMGIPRGRMETDPSRARRPRR